MKIKLFTEFCVSRIISTISQAKPYLKSDKRGGRTFLTKRGHYYMDCTKSLSDMHEGDSARVTSLLTKGSMRRRLQDMGLIEGTLVRCLNRSPSGDPTAYLIRGAVIALRCEDSTNILIE